MDIKQKEHQFYVGELDKPEAVMKFSVENDVIDINHTLVSEELRGQGVGEALFKEVVEYAREHDLKLKQDATCSFGVVMIKRHKKKLEDIL
ncbi:GNAT family N-acetyltransferase [Phocicoccus pinnipedialis]|uniref:Acetyltransferase (GNAT) family protein n=1 Tax=Phocicoccus pinnipedialis TaxID=110845 RepID=A0A6V7R5A5_9BACL|nr:GNAT family N-acetyltransferase [Jeotgalicoccus pinnipedialis]MBP1939631.1 putative GNAT family acetyltransferase [Jeotgalicoccus pinnipedialis]CAD2072253.1 Acetyltransferase (GNAT) family protein [Jeotgalicoccus pinnipedialis]